MTSYIIKDFKIVPEEHVIFVNYISSSAQDIIKAFTINKETKKIEGHIYNEFIIDDKNETIPTGEDMTWFFESSVQPLLP